MSEGACQENWRIKAEASLSEWKHLEILETFRKAQVRVGASINWGANKLRNSTRASHSCRTRYKWIEQSRKSLRKGSAYRRAEIENLGIDKR